MIVTVPGNTEIVIFSISREDAAGLRRAALAAAPTADGTTLETPTAADWLRGLAEHITQALEGGNA
ncbi:MAG: hypothetical protein LBK42_02010 [Propionibacteriaceae bacterium]|jgi:hypothetical protein|nr:hypothetical protein [Propionibacteriaceae bacterium]